MSTRALYAVSLVRDGRTTNLAGAVHEPVAVRVDPASLRSAASRAALVGALEAVHARLGPRLGTVILGLAAGGGGCLLKSAPLLFAHAAGRRQRRCNAAHVEWELAQALGSQRAHYASGTAIVGRQALIAAARHELLDLYAGVCREAGLPVPVFEVQALALVNAAEAAGVLAAAPLCLLVSCAGAAAELVAVRDQSVRQVAYCSLDAAGTALPACARALAAGSSGGQLQPGAAGVQVWVAGEQAERVGAQLGRELGCSAAALPWHRLVGEAATGVEDARFAVAAGLAVGRLDR